MASEMRLPKRVRAHLLPDEKVAAKFSSLWRDYYATDRRILGFERPEWVAMFFLLSPLPGILAWLLTKKTYFGAIEWSRISAVRRNSRREAVFLAVGAAVGGFFITFGLILSVAMWTEGAGPILILLGLFLLTLFSYFRQSIYQLEATDLPKKQARKWYFAKRGRGGQGSQADEFAQLLAEKARAWRG